MTGKVGAVIVAAGASQRMGTDKMLVPIAGRPLLAHTLAAFQDSAVVDDIVLVMSAHNLAAGRDLARSYPKVTQVCLGGELRQDSVLAGLVALGECQFVLVHDGARPLVTEDIIQAGLDTARRIGAAVAGVPVKDTIKIVDATDLVLETPDRRQLRAVQTPQVFRYHLLLDAYRRIRGQQYTDDAAVVEAAGHLVAVYPGSYENIKVTTREDVEVAEAILRRRAAQP